VGWRRPADVVDDVGRGIRSSRSLALNVVSRGLCWASTLGRRVGFDSWVERDHLVALDFDASVVGIACLSRWVVLDGAGRHDQLSMRIAPRTMVGATNYQDRSVQESRGCFAELRELCSAAGDKVSLAIGMTGLATELPYAGRTGEGVAAGIRTDGAARVDRRSHLDHGISVDNGAPAATTLPTGTWRIATARWPHSSTSKDTWRGPRR